MSDQRTQWQPRLVNLQSCALSVSARTAPQANTDPTKANKAADEDLIDVIPRPIAAELAGFQCKSNFERYLIVINNSVLDVAPCLNNFKPSHIADSRFGPRYGILNSVFDTLIR